MVAIGAIEAAAAPGFLLIASEPPDPKQECQPTGGSTECGLGDAGKALAAEALIVTLLLAGAIVMGISGVLDFGVGVHELANGQYVYPTPPRKATIPPASSPPN